MALAKGVTESFGRGAEIGNDAVSGVLKRRSAERQAEKERLDTLVRYNPSLLTPLDYQNALNEIDKTGKFSLDFGGKNLAEAQPSAGAANAQQTAGVVYAEPTIKSQTQPQPPLSPQDSPQLRPHFGPSQKPSPTDIVVVTPDLSNVTGLPVGTQVQRWQIQSVFAPQARANTMAAAQAGRQETGIEAGKKKDASVFRQNMAKSAYQEFLKAKQNGNEDAVREEVANAFEQAGYSPEEIARFRTKQLPNEDGWLGKLFGKVKSAVSGATTVIPAKTTSRGQESATRKRNPQTGKWWVFKDGEWQPE